MGRRGVSLERMYSSCCSYISVNVLVHLYSTSCSKNYLSSYIMWLDAINCSFGQMQYDQFIGNIIFNEKSYI